MSTGTEFLENHTRRRDAVRLQRSADRDTTIRYHGAIPLSLLLGATKPRWDTAAVNFFAWRTDHTDGRKAKKARALWPDMDRSDASKRDPEADKRLQYGNRFALFARACVAKDVKTALVVATETGVSAVRDYRMAHDRQLAETYGVDTDANNVNRIKTALLAAGGIVALSPVAEKHESVKNVALATMCVGTAVGVVGELVYRDNVRQAIAANG